MIRISNVALRLKEYRNSYNLTLSDIEKRTGIPSQTLNRYELGQRAPKLDIAIQIAEALNVNPLWIQGFDVPESPEYIEKPVSNEEDGQIKDLIDVFNSLTSEHQSQAVDYLHFLSAQEQKK